MTILKSLKIALDISHRMLPLVLLVGAVASLFFGMPLWVFGSLLLLSHVAFITNTTLKLSVYCFFNIYSTHASLYLDLSLGIMLFVEMLGLLISVLAWAGMITGSFWVIVLSGLGGAFALPALISRAPREIWMLGLLLLSLGVSVAGLVGAMYLGMTVVAFALALGSATIFLGFVSDFLDARYGIRKTVQPFNDACARGDIMFVSQMLLEHPKLIYASNVFQSVLSVLHVACDRGETAIVDALIQSCPPNDRLAYIQRAEYGTPGIVHVITRHGFGHPLVRLLQRYGAQIPAPFNRGLIGEGYAGHANDDSQSVHRKELHLGAAISLVRQYAYYVPSDSTEEMVAEWVTAQHAAFLAWANMVATRTDLDCANTGDQPSGLGGLLQASSINHFKRQKAQAASARLCASGSESTTEGRTGFTLSQGTAFFWAAIQDLFQQAQPRDKLQIERMVVCVLHQIEREYCLDKHGNETDDYATKNDGGTCVGGTFNNLMDTLARLEHPLGYSLKLLYDGTATHAQITRMLQQSIDDFLNAHRAVIVKMLDASDESTRTKLKEAEAYEPMLELIASNLELQEVFQKHQDTITIQIPLDCKVPEMNDEDALNVLLATRPRAEQLQACVTQCFKDSCDRTQLQSYLESLGAMLLSDAGKALIQDMLSSHRSDAVDDADPKQVSAPLLFKGADPLGDGTSKWVFSRASLSLGVKGYA